MWCSTRVYPWSSAIQHLLHNVIANASKLLNIILFPDEINIFISGKYLSEICAAMNKELYELLR